VLVCSCSAWSYSFDVLIRETVTNTDDFLWRLVKGCIQVGFTPEINNTINMVPVDHVARCVVAGVLHPASSPSIATVMHVTARPAPTYNTLFSSLPSYGYDVVQTSYITWRQKLESHVLESSDNALFPLLHFVLDDLPTSTKSPELSDANMRVALKGEQWSEKETVDEARMGLYIAWLVKAGFLPGPSAEGKEKLPELQGSVKAVGRSGA
jgi:L-2-aminoadipate reductase